MNPSEEWRKVPDWPLYEVSDQGRVRRALDTAATRNTAPGRLRKSFPDKNGYMRVVLCGPQGARKLVGVHQLVLRSFVGDAPEDHEAAHENGNPADNRLSNLSWSTHVDNIRDKHRHGTMARGSRIHCAKLTREQAVEIIHRRRARERTADIAKDYGVSTTAILLICSGRNWKELGGVNGPV